LSFGDLPHPDTVHLMIQVSHIAHIFNLPELQAGVMHYLFCCIVLRKQWLGAGRIEHFLNYTTHGCPARIPLLWSYQQVSAPGLLQSSTQVLNKLCEPDEVDLVEHFSHLARDVLRNFTPEKCLWLCQNRHVDGAWEKIDVLKEMKAQFENQAEIAEVAREVIAEVGHLGAEGSDAN
jgi:hypothetical protein